MAKQTITLDFKANIENAKNSLVSLAQAYRQAMESGDPAQKSEVQKAIQERTADPSSPFSDTDQISAQLEKAIALQKEFEASEIKINDLKQSSLRFEEEARQIQRDKKTLLDEAAQILGKEGGIKITELRQEFALLQKNNEELAKKGQLTEEDKKTAQDVFNILEGYETKLKQQKDTNVQAKKIEDQKTAALKEQKVRTEQIAKILEGLALTDDERAKVMGDLLLLHVETEESLKRSTKEAERLTQESVKIKKEQKEVASTLASAKDSFAGKAIQAAIYYQALTTLRRVARAAVSTLRELDKALTDIAVVTAMSREQSWRLLGTYQDMAKQVGLTTTEVANLSIAFFRQGRSARDALQLTETAAKFAKIAAIDVNDAANFLTAAINGFNLAASEAERIIDRFAALGAGAAASASEIAIALSKVAPAAASAGVEIDNLMAFVTKGIETTREAPENIGTAFKTIFARMRELTDIGKVMEDGMDVNRVESALASVGVALRDANGQFRNLDQVLIEVGQKWETIDRNSQAYLATTLAGTRQQTRLIALFEDFDRTLELIELSQNSAGVATIQHTEFMRGMEAATTRLKTSFQELITAFVNSNQIIAVINGLNTAMELLNTFAGRAIVTITILAGVIATAANANSKLHKAIVAVNGAFAKDGLLRSFNAWTVLIGKQTNSLSQAVRTTTLYKTALKNLNKTNTTTISLLDKLILRLFGTAHRKAQAAAATTKFNLANLFSIKTLVGLKTGLIKANVALFKFILLLLKTPLGLLVLISGLVLGFKKLMDATDTTNDTVARLQVMFKAMGRSIKKLAEGFVEGTKALFKFLGPFGKLLKLAIALAFPIVGIGMAMIKAFELFQPPVQKAAGSFVALQNRLGKLNEEIRNLDSEARKLRNTLNEFERLSRITFLSPEELARFNELQTQLQLDLETGATGDDLINIATATLNDTTNKLKQATEEQRTEIADFFQKNPLADFSDLAQYEGFDESTKNNLRIVATDYATSLIEGFDNMAPEVQEAIRRMVEGDIENVIDGIEQQGPEVAAQDTELSVGGILGFGAFNMVVKEGESVGEAYQRAVAEGMTGFGAGTFERAFNQQIGLATRNIISGPIPDLGEQIAEAYTSMSETGFAEGVASIQGILGDLNADELEEALRVLSGAYPDIEAIFNLLDGQAEAIGSRASLRDFTAFENLASDIFTDASGVFDKDAADEFLSNIFDTLIASDPDERIEVGSRLMQEVLAGMTNVPAEAQTRVANAIQDFLIPADLDSIITAAFGTSDSIDRLYDLFGQGFNISQEDMQFLSERFPESLVDILNGTADLNEIQAETTKGLLEQLDAREKAIVATYRTLEAEGQLTPEAERRLALKLQEIQVARAQLNQSRALTDDIKARFEAERASLKEQRSAIEQAKQLRDLQDRARETSVLSTQATRIGAVGTIEAQFNQNQLQDQIQQMNRDLEERIQIAKLEAQDRILEETQRRLLLDAQEKNTVALETLSEVITRVSGSDTPLLSIEQQRVNRNADEMMQRYGIDERQ